MFKKKRKPPQPQNPQLSASRPTLPASFVMKHASPEMLEEIRRREEKQLRGTEPKLAFDKLAKNLLKTVGWIAAAATLGAIVTLVVQADEATEGQASAIENRVGNQNSSLGPYYDPTRPNLGRRSAPGPSQQR